jgi:hypothetical protein
VGFRRCAGRGTLAERSGAAVQRLSDDVVAGLRGTGITG